MINELHNLSAALSKSEITVTSWHRDYKPIPNISAKAPCVRIVVEDGKVTHLELIDAELGKCLRKYGDNHGTFPAMNLAALYRLTDERQIELCNDLLKSDRTDYDVEELRSWCMEDNWCRKFQDKYHRCLEEKPHKLEELLQGQPAFEPIRKLIRETSTFSDPKRLHDELFYKAFEMLEEKTDIKLALRLLFYAGSKKQAAEDDYGSLAVIFDTYVLEDDGIPTAGIKFTKLLNQALLQAEANLKPAGTATADTSQDAFGLPYTPVEEPMPSIKLAAGFDVSLRTMFKGQPCQYRYGRIEGDTYPLGKEKRQALKDALEWLSAAEHQNKTWVSTDKNEALFVYLSCLSTGSVTESATQTFDGGGEQKKAGDSQKKATFEAAAKSFCEYLSRTKELDPEHRPTNVQIFMLKKLDKARTKVLYSRNTTRDEIARRSDHWQKAAHNLPEFHIGTPNVPFPLKIAPILNRVWKRDGTSASTKLKATPTYHGMELLFGVSQSVIRYDLQILMRNAENLAIYAGSVLNASTRSMKQDVLIPLMQTLSLIGILLYELGLRKENYMENYAYLLGQMLKVSDSLHELYCLVVRSPRSTENTEPKKGIPQQLVGGSFYAAAADFPVQTLSQLGKRMMPYLTWARTHLTERIETVYEEDGEKKVRQGPNAGYYLHIYQQLADKLSEVLDDTTRFTEKEKAQLFLGYLGSFPKSELKNKL